MIQDINGILLLDKASGITSNRALQQVKHLFGKKVKAGHTGSLDPLATGMLPICFGKSTKLSGGLLNSDKKYIVTGQFGIKTDTADIDGNVTATQDNINNIFNNLTKELIQLTLEQFIGEIWQTPPIYSALKHNGVRLYKLARQNQNNPNINIEIKPRLIKIYSIKLLNVCNIKHQINLEVHCGKGTYIRTLVEDIAAKLDCLATVSKLHRVSVGDFDSSCMISFNKLLEKSKEELMQLLII
jgi:tRNA pseudouridine55 synthase